MNNVRFIILLLTLILICRIGQTQPAGYYDGTEGKNGEMLKETLHQIISNHRIFSYYSSKTIMKYADADPNHPGNVILVYTGRSQSADDYGSSGNQLNREHVWAKSHGGFDEVLPMYSDVHNLKPADASVNQDKSNKDFDNGGTQHQEATGCYYTQYTWEPRDEVKGDIARIIFYMAVRYEGDFGELDLEAVDAINTYPEPEHGRLSTLLAWNHQDPPDEFEINRNNVIYAWQQNRNPFIDNPEFASLIWDNQAANPVQIEEISQTPKAPILNNAVTISSKITSYEATIQDASLFWGYNRENLNQEIEMDVSGDFYSAVIPTLPGPGTLFFKIMASDGINTAFSIIYSADIFDNNYGSITSIYDIQGQSMTSPYAGQSVTTGGIVTADFGEFYFIQDGAGAWNGIMVADPNRYHQPGDNILITGTVSESAGMTILQDVSGYLLVSGSNPLPEPIAIGSGSANEEYEGVLVKINDALCTDANYYANDYMWKINDSSGTMLVHNTDLIEYKPVLGKFYTVSGPVNYKDGNWRIELRSDNDVKGGGDQIKPYVTSVTAWNSEVIRTVFSESVTESSAENTDNYLLTGNIRIENAVRHENNKNTVSLLVSGMVSGQYNITLGSIEDLNGNILDQVTLSFTYTSNTGPYQEGHHLNVYPNPATDQIFIKTDRPEKQKTVMALYDVHGFPVVYQEILICPGEDIHGIKTNTLSPGIYFLSIRNKEESFTQKIIISNFSP